MDAQEIVAKEIVTVDASTNTEQVKEQTPEVEKAVLKGEDGISKAELFAWLENGSTMKWASITEVHKV